MRKTLGSVLLAFVTARVEAQPASRLSKEAREFVSVDAPVVALVGVQVVDGTGAPPKAAQTVVIDNGRIQAVGPVADVAIPAGVDEGMQVRLTGEGEPSPNGGPPGDAYCFIHVRKHPLFQRDGVHLILRLPISYSQAALGA